MLNSANNLLEVIVSFLLLKYLMEKRSNITDSARTTRIISLNNRATSIPSKILSNLSVSLFKIPQIILGSEFLT